MKFQIPLKIIQNLTIDQKIICRKWVGNNLSINKAEPEMVLSQYCTVIFYEIKGEVRPMFEETCGETLWKI